MKWAIVQLGLCIVMWSFIIALGAFVLQSRKNSSSNVVQVQHEKIKETEKIQPKKIKVKLLEPTSEKPQALVANELIKPAEQCEIAEQKVDNISRGPFKPGSIWMQRMAMHQNNQTADKPEQSVELTPEQKVTLEAKKAITKIFVNILSDVANENSQSPSNAKKTRDCVAIENAILVPAFHADTRHQASEKSMKHGQTQSHQLSNKVNELVQLDRLIIKDILRNLHSYEAAKRITQRECLLEGLAPEELQRYHQILCSASGGNEIDYQQFIHEKRWKERLETKKILRNTKIALDNYICLARG